MTRTIVVGVTERQPDAVLQRAAVDAALIVVGTHEGGWLGSLQQLVGGSVAMHLAHRQRRPVVVVPLDPVGLDGSLSWESEA